MRRCENCRHDNADDAVSCVQCGRPLTSTGDASAEQVDGALDGVAGAELVTPVAGNGSGSASPSAADGLSAGNAIERAATLTVEVRRTSVPLLAPSQFVAAPVAMPTPSPVATPEAASVSRTARSRWRWLLALALLIIVIAAVVIYLLLAHLI